jgi:hypothetical protein
MAGKDQDMLCRFGLYCIKCFCDKASLSKHADNNWLKERTVQSHSHDTLHFYGLKPARNTPVAVILSALDASEREVVRSLIDLAQSKRLPCFDDALKSSFLLYCNEQQRFILRRMQEASTVAPLSPRIKRLQEYHAELSQAIAALAPVEQSTQAAETAEMAIASNNYALDDGGFGLLLILLIDVE